MVPLALHLWCIHHHTASVMTVLYSTAEAGAGQVQGPLKSLTRNNPCMFDALCCNYDYDNDKLQNQI